MPRKTVHKRKISTSKRTRGVDRKRNGEFKDKRKSRTFIVKEQSLKSKTTLTGLRKTVFLDRYSLKNEKGNPVEKYPEQMWVRVAKGTSQFEKTAKKRKIWEEKFYNAMENFKFVPAGRVLSGAGTGYEVTFFNCYVIPSPKDSRGGIMESITHTVEMQARGGGVGLNLSSLRPRGERVRKVNGTSSGPVNWASLYSTANHDVIQQGGSRRGALMLMLHDWHPDVIEFIRVKEDLTKIPGANLSVCVSDKFMEAVKKDANWKLVFPDINDPEYDEVWDGDIDKWRELGKKVIVHNTVKAKDVWQMIAKAAWRSAEPGLHFLERSNKRSNTWYFEKLVATNPCGEQPLGAWSVCNLGAMNLSAYVNDAGQFDYKGLSEDVKVAVRLMDNVVDANFYFYQENKEAQEKIRRIGLGTLGLGDTLIKMKVRYGSEESISIIDKIYRIIRDNAYEASSDIAKEKGSFPEFDKKKYLQGYFIKRLPKRIQEKIKKQGIRNAVLLTQAPTGTTSLISGVSSGIEPNYDFEFKRSDRTGKHIILHPLYKEWKENHPNEKKPAYFVTSNDLTPEDHVRVQAKVQSYTDSSISKTVNAPEKYTAEDVEKLYQMAYDLGCKGITFFRDGSRKGVLERTSDKKEQQETNGNGKTNGHIVPGEPLVERPLIVRGSTYRLNTPVGSAFVTINESEGGEPLEVFINVGKAGSDVTAMAEALGRTISTTLRLRGATNSKQRVKELIDQLSGIGGRHSVGFGPNKILSLPDAIASALSLHYGFKTNGNGNGKSHLNGNIKAETKLGSAGAVMVASSSAPADQTLTGLQDPTMASAQPISAPVGKKGDICPSCGASTFVYEEGCAKCYSCGHSEC